MDAEAIRADALRKLAARRLSPQDLERVRRLAGDADAGVARAAETLLADKAEGESGGSAGLQDDVRTGSLDRLIAELGAAEDATRARAAERPAIHSLLGRAMPPRSECSG